eukprot:TRINITY_DN13484_c0_g1_i1.p1 TRINITY_DN13484_c0_g1~~TRINITY_DN13484_c0_g1_i1.p1  ORF type:complete len:291 (-),score=47.84 TRINITY_DN13484_c0_g1_i1:64-936(-)
MEPDATTPSRTQYTDANVEHNRLGQLKNVNRLIVSNLMGPTGAAAVPRPVLSISQDKFTCRVSVERPVDSPFRVQRVHMVRHGEGYHNLLTDLFNAAEAKRPSQVPEMRDPPLTDRGRTQARSLRAVSTEAQLVVCSPMHRAIQTAVLGFPGLRQSATWVVRPEVREKHHGGDWDATRDTELAAEEFDWCDWSACPPSDPLPLGEMETDEHVRARGEEFLQWLCTREESEVVVATHSALLFNFLNLCVDCEGIRTSNNLMHDECELASELQCPWFMPGECKSLWFEYVKQ